MDIRRTIGVEVVTIKKEVMVEEIHQEEDNKSILIIEKMIKILIEKITKLMIEREVEVIKKEVEEGEEEVPMEEEALIDDNYIANN